MAKRPVRAAAVKAAYIDPESEPEHDSLSSDEDVAFPCCPTPTIPLHLRPASDATNKRTRPASPEEGERNGEGSSSRGPGRKKRAVSVVSPAGVVDQNSPQFGSGLDGNNGAPRLAREERSNVMQMENAAGLSTKDLSPSIGQGGEVRSNSLAAAGSPSHLVPVDVGHEQEAGPRSDTSTVQPRAPRRTPWSMLQSGAIRVFNSVPLPLLSEAPNNIAPVAILDDLSTNAIGKCVEILVAEQDRLRAEHSATSATINRLGHSATLQWQVAVRLASIERTVRHSDLGHADVESKRAAAIWHMYSTALALPPPDDAHETGHGGKQFGGEQQQVPSARSLGTAATHSLARQAEAARQDHEATAARVQDAARRFVVAEEALAVSKFSLEEFNDKTKARLECLEAQIVYVGRCLDAVQIFAA